MTNPSVVIPANAGTQSALRSRVTPWVPAFAGMTKEGGGLGTARSPMLPRLRGRGITPSVVKGARP